VRNLPPSLVIALWLTGAIWFVALLLYEFGVHHHVLYATFLFGLAAACIEWRTSRRS
jgi:hypothetical protein